MLPRDKETCLCAMPRDIVCWLDYGRLKVTQSQLFYGPKLKFWLEYDCYVSFEPSAQNQFKIIRQGYDQYTVFNHRPGHLFCLSDEVDDKEYIQVNFEEEKEDDKMICTDIQCMKSGDQGWLPTWALYECKNKLYIPVGWLIREKENVGLHLQVRKMESGYHVINHYPDQKVEKRDRIQKNSIRVTLYENCF